MGLIKIAVVIIICIIIAGAVISYFGYANSKPCDDLCKSIDGQRIKINEVIEKGLCSCEVSGQKVYAFLGDSDG